MSHAQLLFKLALTEILIGGFLFALGTLLCLGKKDLVGDIVGPVGIGLMVVSAFSAILGEVIVIWSNPL